MVTGSFNQAGAPAVRHYIDQIVDYVEAHSIQPPAARTAFAAGLRAETRNAATFRDTHPAIRAALDGLGDGHSFLCPKEHWTDANITDNRLPSGHMVGDVAYMNMPGCLGDERRCGRYAEHGQRIIALLDKCRPKGWVVDLRGNDGGNCWPMLAAAGPLFEHGTEAEGGLLGHFVMRTGRESFGYQNGASWCVENGRRGDCLSVATPFRLTRPATPVAVLMGPQTSSAGETIAVAALGLKPRLRVFGGPSAGQATGNCDIPGLIDDGAMIALAVSTYADRTGRVHGRVLQPDVTTAQAGPDDPVPAEALAWVRSGPSMQPEPGFVAPPTHLSAPS